MHSFYLKILLLLLICMFLVLTGCNNVGSSSEESLETSSDITEIVSIKTSSGNSVSDNVTKKIKYNIVNEKSDVTETNKNEESYSSATVSSHVHSYTSHVIEPTCTESGCTVHTCNCGASYNDSKTSAIGHGYSEWVVVTAATTSSAGSKERTCTRCNNKQTEVIQKLDSAYDNVDSVVEIGTMKYTNEPVYKLGKIWIIDKRTWGEAPVITVHNGNSMHVIYYNKNNERVEFDAEQPGIDGYINGISILDDGTYVSQLTGSYS